MSAGTGPEGAFQARRERRTRTGADFIGVGLWGKGWALISFRNEVLGLA
jgi:hypothetical protein